MSDDLSIDDVLALLDANPARLADITRGLSNAQLHRKPAPDEWSANDVLAHLRCCADVWGAYIARILEQDRPTYRAESPRGRLEHTDYPETPFAESLGAFVTQRAALLARLRAIPGDAWSRAATVKHAGKVKTLTVLSYARQLAQHEHKHMAQFERIRSVV